MRHDGALEPTDPLTFIDSKSYGERISASQRKTGERDAYIAGSGMIEGIPGRSGRLTSALWADRWALWLAS